MTAYTVVFTPSLEAFGAQLNQQLDRLQQELKEDTYQPLPVRHSSGVVATFCSRMILPASSRTQ
jgi:hypothetical protein